VCTGRANPPVGRGTGKPEEKPAEIQPYKENRTPDREADDKDQGQRQRTPEISIRKTSDQRHTAPQFAAGPQSGITQNNTNNTNNTMYTTDILYATNRPDQVLERLEEMVSTSDDVCLRLEMLESPISVYGIIRKKGDNIYTVESSDEQSHATFSAKQVTSIGAVSIWITL
jgi:hypothetical protein